MMSFEQINEALDELDCSEDPSGFLQENPPTDMIVYLGERWNNYIKNVNFSRSMLFGLIWDTEFHNCDFSGSDLSGLTFRELNGFYGCFVDENTIPPTTSEGDIFPGFSEAIECQKNVESVFLVLKSRRIPICTISKILDYYLICDVNSNYCS